MFRSEFPYDPEVLKTVRRMTSLAGAARTDAIAVAGPRALDHVLALLQSGFERAICICGSHPSACGEHVEHLFVCGPLDDGSLRTLIGGVGRHLSPSGSLVVRLRAAEQDSLVQGVLARSGVAQPRPVFDVSRDILVRHRLSQPAPLARAA